MNLGDRLFELNRRLIENWQNMVAPPHALTMDGDETAIAEESRDVETKQKHLRI